MSRVRRIKISGPCVFDPRGRGSESDSLPGRRTEINQTTIIIISINLLSLLQQTPSRHIGAGSSPQLIFICCTSTHSTPCQTCKALSRQVFHRHLTKTTIAVGNRCSITITMSRPPTPGGLPPAYTGLALSPVNDDGVTPSSSARYTMRLLPTEDNVYRPLVPPISSPLTSKPVHTSCTLQHIPLPDMADRYYGTPPAVARMSPAMRGSRSPQRMHTGSPFPQSPDDYDQYRPSPTYRPHHRQGLSRPDSRSGLLDNLPQIPPPSATDHFYPSYRPSSSRSSLSPARSPTRSSIDIGSTLR